MNREQQAVFSLLKEIDAICKKHKITYYLAPELTLYAIKEQPFPKNPMAGRLMMKIGDMEKFRQVVEEEKPDRRIVESMYNNERFPGFYLRYTNMDTLCFRLNEGRNFKHPGIGIDIYPLRGKMPSRWKHLWNMLLETGWKQLCDTRMDDYDGEGTDRFCKFIVGPMCLTGRGRLGRKLYNKFTAEQNVAGTKEYVVRLKKKTIYYPAEIFQKTIQVEWEGVKFSVPANVEDYLCCRYGSGYEKNVEEQFTPSLTVFTSALVGYEEFFREAGSPVELIKERRRQYRKDAKGRKRRVYLDWAWNHVKFTAVKIQTAEKYKKKKDYLINLYENRDYMRLDSAFGQYTKIMKKCMEENTVFVADRETMNLYMKVLEKTGKNKLKEQIEKNWKKEEDL